MKRAVMAAALVLPLMAFDEAQVQKILDRLETLAKMRLEEAPAFKVYDPFRRVEPMIAKARPILRPTPPRMPRPKAIFGNKAFVDGRWVRAGEKIGRFVVVRIGAGGVWLRDGKGCTRYLSLWPKGNLLETKDGKR